MKVSLNIAQELANVDIKSLSTKDLIKLATERLGGVEGYDNYSKHYDGIVVAKVVSCVKHPNADKLSLCKIDDGGKNSDVERDSNGYVQVVCGAPNIKEGLLVAWIPPKAIVPSSYGEKELFVLEARDLRGQLSNGMIASPRELGLNDDHDGVLVISEDIQLGTSFSSLYNLDDVIIDIENKMFTHRPDCFGQLGVARELAAIQGLKFESPTWYREPVKFDTSSSDSIKGLSVTNEIPDLCPRYMAISFDDVKIQPSPIWLQSYLKRLGVRPINNIVDITNYIMLTTAQPLHAFDFDKIAKNSRAEIVIRKPKADEKMSLLDGKEITPHTEAILICNQEKPIALGGVMGGGNSEIDENTKRIILECATFDMYSIRKTSMTHGLFTDAVTRFNKGQPAGQLPVVLHQAVKMIQEVTGANPVGEVVDSYPNKVTNQPVQVSVEFINSRLGSSFSAYEIQDSLLNVEFAVDKDGDNLEITAPFWRTDIEIPEDIIEEVGRLYGFNNLPINLPNRSIKPVKLDAKATLKNEVRQILKRGGANEILSYSFVHGDLLNKVGQRPENSYALRNALSPDLQYYRQTLTPSLLDLVHPNVKAGFSEFALFEINKSHNKIHSEDTDGLPGQLNMISLVYTNNKSKNSAYYTARTYLDYLADSLGFTLIYNPIDKDPGYPVTQPFDFERSALVTVKEADIFLGIIGEFKQSVVGSLKLPLSTAGFEIGLDHLIEARNSLSLSRYKPLSKYPSSEQDITLSVNADIKYSQLENVLIQSLDESDYNYNLIPLSIYSKEGSKEKNISFRVILTSYKHTLTTKEVSDIIDVLAINAQNTLKARKV